VGPSSLRPWIIASGAWHLFTLHAIVNRTSSSVDVSVDGVTVPGLTLAGQDFGTSPIARLALPLALHDRPTAALSQSRRRANGEGRRFSSRLRPR
jgi:hypothetical protein